MIFTLRTAEGHYKDKTLIDKYKKLGFEFELYFNDIYRISGNPQIEIKDLSELMDFIKEHGVVIIDEPNEIQIYDGYIE